MWPVQDIYGLEQSHAPREDLTEEENEDRLCVICLVNERNTTVLPCRHMCMCDECAQELRKQTHKCPICRIHVRLLLFLHCSVFSSHCPLFTSCESARLPPPTASIQSL